MCTDTTNDIDAKLRSILMHPMGMLLTALLNDGPRPNIPSEDFWSVANINNNNDADFPTYDAAGTLDQDFILAAAITKWNGHDENSLTETIASYVRALSEDGKIDGYGNDGRGNSLQLEEQKNTKSRSNDQKKVASHEEVVDENRVGRMDFVISEVEQTDTNHQGNSKAPVVAIYEVGIHHNLWWAKTEQILRYVQSIRNSGKDSDKFRVEQPILLTVVTISKSSNDESNETRNSNFTEQMDTCTISKHSKGEIDSNYAERMETCDQTNKRPFSQFRSIDHVEEGNKVKGQQESEESCKILNAITLNDFKEHREKFVSLQDGEGGAVAVQYGTFLFTPKGPKDYRISLLWRKKAASLKEASTDFGKLLFASKMCLLWRKSFANAQQKLYEYLGPNCCRIEESVSILYFFWMNFKNELEHHLRFALVFYLSRNIACSSIDVTTIDYDRRNVVHTFMVYRYYNTRITETKQPMGPVSTYYTFQTM